MYLLDFFNKSFKIHTSTINLAFGAVIVMNDTSKLSINYILYISCSKFSIIFQWCGQLNICRGFNGLPECLCRLDLNWVEAQEWIQSLAVNNTIFNNWSRTKPSSLVPALVFGIIGVCNLNTDRSAIYSFRRTMPCAMLHI